MEFFAVIAKSSTCAGVTARHMKSKPRLSAGTVRLTLGRCPMDHGGFAVARSCWRASSRYSLRDLSQQNHVSKERAQALLRDLAHRLKGQTEFLSSTRAQVLGDERPVSQGCRGGGGGGVVRATNYNVSMNWKETVDKQMRLERVRKPVDKTFRDLLILHRDTYELTMRLLDPDSTFWDSFDTLSHVVTSTMEQVRSRHATTVETMADLVVTLRSAGVVEEEEEDVIEPWLRGRLGVQLLCDHYVTLDKYQRSGVTPHCNISEVIEEAVTEATHLCDAHYQITPEVDLADQGPQDQVSCTLVRPWVHHSLTEILKNAMAATIDHHHRQATTPQATTTALPPIEIDIVEDDDSVRIVVRDKGMGLESGFDAFRFASSSVDKRWDRLEEQQSYAMVRSPLQSLGVGLPMSRWMMQHFGGNVDLVNNVDDQGCIATLSLSRDDSLPEYFP